MPEQLYRFIDMETELPYIVMAAKTNRGNLYTLRIELDKFPNEEPKAFVTKMLKDKNGEDMSVCNATMHTLSSENGRTRIQFINSDLWTPMTSIYLIYYRCKIWLEMYELHLQTGNDIDYHLKHQ